MSMCVQSVLLPNCSKILIYFSPAGIVLQYHESSTEHVSSAQLRGPGRPRPVCASAC